MKVDMKDVQEDFKRYQAEIDELKEALIIAIGHINEICHYQGIDAPQSILKRADKVLKVKHGQR